MSRRNPDKIHGTAWGKNRPNILAMYELLLGHEDDTKVCKHCGYRKPYECFIAWNGACVLEICHVCATKAAQANATKAETSKES